MPPSPPREEPHVVVVVRHHGPWNRKVIELSSAVTQQEAAEDYPQQQQQQQQQQSSAPTYTLWDLVSVGVGGTVGSGIFVLTGYIAHHYSGPATFLSFLMSGGAAIVSGLSFCEWSARLPRMDGSTYTYVGFRHV